MAEALEDVGHIEEEPPLLELSHVLLDQMELKLLQGVELGGRDNLLLYSEGVSERYTSPPHTLVLLATAGLG